MVLRHAKKELGIFIGMLVYLILNSIIPQCVCILQYTLAFEIWKIRWTPIIVDVVGAGEGGERFQSEIKKMNLKKNQSKNTKFKFGRNNFFCCICLILYFMGEGGGLLQQEGNQSLIAL